jgi:hypothetical protein
LDIEHRWNDTDKEQSNNPKENLSQCNFLNDRYYRNWTGIETEPPLCKIGDLTTGIKAQLFEYSE